MLGVETSDEYVDDRIYELTGVRDFLLTRDHGDRAEQFARETGRWDRAERRGVGGRLYLEPKFPIDYFRGQRCIDIGCGAGRWTRAMIAMGADVKSIKGSNAGLELQRVASIATSSGRACSRLGNPAPTSWAPSTSPCAGA